MSNNESTDLTQLSDQLADAVDQAAQSVVLVDGRRRMPASGIVLNETMVLAADHAVEGDGPITLINANGDELSAKIGGRDPGSDLVLLTADSGLGQPLAASDSSARVGQIALALGRPSATGIQASLGIVSAVGSGVRSFGKRGKGRRGRGHHGRRHHKHAQTAEQVVRTDAIPYPGFSGGPLIDGRGQVLGINTSGLYRGVSIAVPIARGIDIANALSEHGSVRRGYLGVRSQPAQISESQQAVLGRDQESGLLIVWIESGGPAERGGLLVGDILVALDETPISDAQDLQISLAANLAGQQATIQIMRGGEPALLNVEIGERA